MPEQLIEKWNPQFGKCPTCKKLIEAIPVAIGVYSLPECCDQSVQPIYPGEFNIGQTARLRKTNQIGVIADINDEGIVLDFGETDCLYPPMKVLQYVMDDECVVDVSSGGVMYDCLEEMPMLTRLRLAELATEHLDWDWARSAKELEAEGFVL